MAARRDPRRAPKVVDPLEPFGRNDMCWCASGRKYKDCHLPGRQLTVPGAPVPPDTDDAIYIAPHTSLAPDALQARFGNVPMTVQQPRPQAAPVTLPDMVRTLAGQTRGGLAPPHAELGTLRFALLDAHGLTDAPAVRAGRNDAVLRSMLGDLADAALDLAGTTFDRLLQDAARTEPPVVLRSDAADVPRLVGQTLLWADHYLVDDSLAELAANGVQDLSRWRDAVAGLLALRPLVEAGIAVPALAGLALSLLSEAVDRQVDRELGDPMYVAWLEQQVLLEGPTAREVTFAHVIDHDREAGFYMLAPVRPGSPIATDDGTVRFATTPLGRYDPAKDYAPWLSTVRRQVVSSLARDLVSDVAGARAVGADFVTTSPFRARALARRPIRTVRGGDHVDVAPAVWADVPWLPDASPAMLARLAANDERVHGLRKATARALRSARTSGASDAGATAVSETAADLRDAAESLTVRLRRDVIGNGLVPMGMAAGSVLLAATVTPLVGAAAGLAGGAALLPALRGRRSESGAASYAFWLARPRPRPPFRTSSTGPSPN